MDVRASNDAARSGSMPVWNFGQEKTEAAGNLQKELLNSYEEASRAWLARVSQRVQMAAADGRRLVEDSQAITQKLTQSLAKGWPAAKGNA
jgi:hypothetical protein